MLTVLLLLVLGGCLLAVCYTYLFYPTYVIGRAERRRGLRARPPVQGKGQESGGNWPPVAVLMAAHNEEKVIALKLATLAAQDYPGPLHFLVGSDNSTDATNDILTEWANRDERFTARLFTERRGKPGIINELAAAAADSAIFVITDASVMLRPNVVTELVRPFRKDYRVGVVDATMVQTGAAAAGIGRTEAGYIDREVRLKRAEGELWGTMVGPFGGCWALRAAAFRPVPPNFLVDDFYLCLAAYDRGYRGVSSPAAIVEEGVGQDLSAEFRRKVRIGAGNWQNLVCFRRLLWPPTRSRLAFAVWSHKILRWWTPFFMLLGGACALGLVVILGNHWAGRLLLILLLLPPAAVLLDVALAAAGVHLRPLRSFRYFLAMNAALLVGFSRYLTGIKSNVWQPSQRH